MEFWLFAAIIVLAAVIIGLVFKILLLRKSADEIEKAFSDRLCSETNTLIDISSGDRHMRSLANSINIQLRKLRYERQRFQQGDIELKNAVTNISHDLRTPLTAILGYTDLLERELRLDGEQGGLENVSKDKAKQYIDIIRNRADILSSLTEELFLYSVITSGKDEGEREEVVVNSVLEESIAAFYTVLSERGIAPQVAITEKKIKRKLNSSALTRIFSNLMNNAVKYSDGDLTVTLTDTGEIIFANSASKLNQVQVGRLFDRFYTVEAARQSTGIGLAIAKTLTEQMSGSISAELNEGRLSIKVVFPSDDEK